jgi:hypothetical protein
MTDYSELKALALAATPGPWNQYYGKIFGYPTIEGGDGALICKGFSLMRERETGVFNARFIAAVDPQTVLALLDELAAAQARNRELEALDREAATYVESVICLRTEFTGNPPYVGWKGLGLALSEALDERDNLRRAAAALEGK